MLFLCLYLVVLLCRLLLFTGVTADKDDWDHRSALSDVVNTTVLEDIFVYLASMDIGTCLFEALQSHRS